MLHMLRALLLGLAMAAAMQTTFANFAWAATTDQRGNSFKTCPDLRQMLLGVTDVSALTLICPARRSSCLFSSHG